jgi:hypothetical protein
MGSVNTALLLGDQSVMGNYASVRVSDAPQSASHKSGAFRVRYKVS